MAKTSEVELQGSTEFHLKRLEKGRKRINTTESKKHNHTDAYDHDPAIANFLFL